jgi:N-acetylmuramoyl-L-alanine amidase
MAYKKIVISSGHSTKCQGAVGIINEVNEATRVVNRLGEELQKRGVTVKTYHDTVSTSQNETLNRIVDFHNAQTRELDCSVHFNAYVETTKAMGTECLYVSQSKLAGQVSAAIATCGLIDRGPKYRNDLFFLNNTSKPAILIEVCFVDSDADVKVYQANFDNICDVVADVLGGKDENDWPTPPAPEPEALFHATGKVSHFGGPDDTGVSPSEGLAFIYQVDDAPHLFLPSQPAGTTGLARRLNPYVPYVACRWDYAKTPKPSLLKDVALVRATATGIEMKAFPADWGPHEEKTGRAADISPGLMDALGIETDDEVEVVFPYREDVA